MKNLATLILCLVNATLFAQFKMAEGYYVENKKNKAIFKSIPIWEEHFQNGIPAGWENSGNSTLALWEYRGPNTNPNQLIGSRGSCIPNGTTGEAIASATSADGFIIFDSNYWDNDANPCTAQYFGSGQAPGPHYATLTTSSINLTGHANVALQFEQYARYYAGETSVEISIDNGPWNILFSNVFDQGLTTENTILVRAPLPSAAGNSTNVKLRFVYNGLYYFWQIDDIELIDIYANDLLVEEATYGDFDILDPTHTTGFEYLEYDQYPVNFAPDLILQSNVFNFGTNNQTNVSLTASVHNTNSGTTLYSATSADSAVVISGTTAPFEAGLFTMPNEIGKYEVVFTSNQSEIDENINNSSLTRNFEITPVTFARDKGDLNAVFLPTDEYSAAPYEMGCVYLLPSGGYLESVGVALALGTSTPSTVYASIFPFSLDNGIGNLIATTSDFTVTANDINNYGEENIKLLPFPNPVYLSQGAYLVVVGSPEGAGMVNVGLSGYSEDLTAWVRFNQTDLFYLTRIPMVRMNFGPYTQVSNLSETPKLNLFPNPAQETLFLETNIKQHKNIQIINSAGQEIFSESFSSEETTIQLNIASIPSGFYRIIIRSNDFSFNQSLVIE